MEKSYELFRGDSKNIPVQFIGNYAGGSITFKMKNDKKDTDDDAIIQKREYLELVSGTTNTYKATIKIIPTDSDILPKKYYYDIQYTSADGLTVHTFLYGSFKILVDITRSPNVC